MFTIMKKETVTEDVKVQTGDDGFSFVSIPALPGTLDVNQTTLTVICEGYSAYEREDASGRYIVEKIGDDQIIIKP